MKPPDVFQFEQRLDSLFKRVNTMSYDAEMQSHWARYLCVLVSGYIEISVQSILGSYSQNKADQRVFRHVERNLRRIQNLNMERIMQVVSTFDENWGYDLDGYVTGRIKDSVDSIVANRNSIAHGTNVVITYVRMKNYYDDVKILVDFLTRQCAHSES